MGALDFEGAWVGTLEGAFDEALLEATAESTLDVALEGALEDAGLKRGRRTVTSDLASIVIFVPDLLDVDFSVALLIALLWASLCPFDAFDAFDAFSVALELSDGTTGSSTSVLSSTTR